MANPPGAVPEPLQSIFVQGLLPHSSGLPPAKVEEAELAGFERPTGAHDRSPCALRIERRRGGEIRPASTKYGPPQSSTPCLWSSQQTPSGNSEVLEPVEVVAFRGSLQRTPPAGSAALECRHVCVGHERDRATDHFYYLIGAFACPLTAKRRLPRQGTLRRVGRRFGWVVLRARRRRLVRCLRVSIGGSCAASDRAKSSRDIVAQSLFREFRSLGLVAVSREDDHGAVGQRLVPDRARRAGAARVDHDAVVFPAMYDPINHLHQQREARRDRDDEQNGQRKQAWFFLDLGLGSVLLNGVTDGVSRRTFRIDELELHGLCSHLRSSLVGVLERTTLVPMRGRFKDDDPTLLQQSGVLRDAYIRFLERSAGIDLAFADHEPDHLTNPFAGRLFDRTAAEAALRLLEQQRGYSTWHTVATEPEMDYLYRLATVRKGKGPYLGDRLPPLQAILDRHAEALFKVFERNQMQLPFPVFVGLYPTGGFNAFVEVVPQGALLLVNAGQMDLMFCVLKVNLAASGGHDDPPLLTDGQTTMALAEAFNAYLFGDGSLRAWALPPLDKNRAAVLGDVLGAGHHFVLAHELGHVACGHVHLPDGDGQAQVTLSPQTELEADRFAVDLLVKSIAFEDESPLAQFLAGGILNVLTVAFALEALQKEFGLASPAAGTHPALSERWKHLGAELNERFPAAQPLARGKIFFRWLENHLAGIAAWLRQVDEEMKRPGKYE